jgi:hypothetical protein
VLREVRLRSRDGRQPAALPALRRDHVDNNRTPAARGAGGTKLTSRADDRAARERGRELGDQRPSSDATVLIATAKITAPKRYESSAWWIAARRIPFLDRSVSET